MFKNNFFAKKFQGSLQIGITYDLFFVKLKSGQKNSDQIFKYFFSNSNFLGLKKYPPKSKIQKKNSVEHLKMYLRCYTEKMGQFELLEPKNLCYTSSNFAFWNYFPQEPVNRLYKMLWLHVTVLVEWTQ